MYATQPCKMCRKDAVGRAPLNGIGLGEESEYQGISKTGQMTNTILGMNPNMMVTSVLPGFAKTALAKSGVDLNPISMVLATFTGGLSLLPGISKMLGGMFKKATHMGDCMKWWTDSNIRGMASSIIPIELDFHSYMMKNFPQFLRQYQVMLAGGQWESVGVDRLLSSGNRRARVANEFVKLVRQHPEIMQAECATQPNVIAEIGNMVNPRDVQEAWSQIREAAKQLEYVTLAQEVDKLVAPFKVKETWGKIVQSRSDKLLVRREDGAQLAVPRDVIGVKRGALVQVLKTGQTSLKPVTFGK